MYDFGFLLKRLRKEKHLTQAKVGALIHKSKNIISDYENNVAMPTLDTLISLAMLYRVSLDFLVGIDKKESIIIENYTDTQKELLKLVAEEFGDGRKNRIADGLTPRQQEIIGKLVNEFVKKK